MLQEKKSNQRPISNCSKKIDELSFFWKMDSLGTNGFRAYTYKYLIECNKDSVTIDYLIDKLGKPNQISGGRSGETYYKYTVLDSPKLYPSPYIEFIVLIFVFRANEHFVSDIGINDN